MRLRVSAPVPPGELVGDGLIVVGVGSLAVGVGLWSVPLMLIVVGVLLFLLGLGLTLLSGPRKGKAPKNAAGPFDPSSAGKP